MSDLAPIICTGQMRSGTTWLYEAFREADTVWRPPAKELRLLSAIDDVGPTTCYERYAPFGRGDGLGRPVGWWKETTWQPYLRAMIEQIDSWLVDDFYAPGSLELEFWMTYLGRPHTLQTYAELCRLVGPQRLLDISPDYLSLSSHMLMQVRDAFDSHRFIVALRDPLERMRSQVQFDVEHGAIAADPGADELAAYVTAFQQSRWQWSQVEVQVHIRRLEEIFGADAVFIVFFEDMRRDPAELCRRLALFCESTVPTWPDRAPNPGRTAPLAASLDAFAVEATERVSEALAEMVGGHALAWLARREGAAPVEQDRHTVLSGVLAEIRRG